MKRFILVFALVLAGCAVKKQQPIVRSYNSPEETFQTWRQAAERLDFETLISCYAKGSQAGVRKDIEQTSAEGLRYMQDETKRTEFKIEKIVYERDRAYLRTSRHVPEDHDVEVLTMIKENNQWKFLP